MKDDSKLDIEDLGGEKATSKSDKKSNKNFSKNANKNSSNGRSKSIAKRRKKKTTDMRTLMMCGLATIVVLIAVFVILLICNRNYVKFSIKDGSTRDFEYGDTFDPAEVTAYYTGSVFRFIHKPVDVTFEGETEFADLGDYEMTYTAEYKGKTYTAKQTLHVQDTTAPVITLEGEGYCSPGYTYEEEGYTAIDAYEGDVTDRVVRTESGDTVTYTVSDCFDHVATVERTIIYEDHVAPDIVLNGDAKVYIDKGSTYKELGCTCVDDVDGEMTDSVTIEGTVDSSTYGIYEITYTCTDSCGNKAVVIREVCVRDYGKPEITLEGDSVYYLNVGDSYDEPGYSAYDEVQGDMTADVEVNGTVDTSTGGVYYISYSVRDWSDNTDKKTRLVYVADPNATVVEPTSTDKKVVYLTFDDGPGPYTEKLLDVLDKYDVKATFFVTKQYKDYIDLIGEEASRGHTVAIHTYTHDYAKIYASTDNYFEDLAKMAELIYEQTGEFPTLLRFPGGTSNTISRKYMKGIMSTLAEKVVQYGYQYTDWNITSGDSGETTETSVVAQNVINGMKNHDVSIVLQHDIKGFSVDAVETIIKYGLDNGYTFLPMDETSPVIHWKANN